MADPDRHELRFDVGAVTGPPFGVWRPIGGGVEVMARAGDTLGTLWIRHASKADVVHPDGTHVYWSTWCRCAENHDACNATTINGGPRRPAQAKCCGAPCVCPCHQEESK